MAVPPDIGGPLANLSLRFELLRPANAADGPEVVIHTQVLDRLYPGVPIRLPRLSRSVPRSGDALAVRLTVIRGDGSVIGDFSMVRRYHRRPAGQFGRIDSQGAS